MPLTLGTAGHIDHGKTALIAALTGVDTDRLPEEKARGISIALGYAALDLPSGRRLSVVDVPGHERFVRTMVAGATGIDLYLMAVAADDGVMPQTREHAAVLAGLGVEAGVVAVTKADLADPAPAAAQARDLLPGAEVVAVSARTGEGLDDLRAALDRVASALPSRADRGGALRLHVDRSFTVHGAGTVVTGTLWAGTVARGDDVTLLPAGRRARVRSVQVHDAPVERAQAGQRVALNLAGVARDEAARGDVVVAGTEVAPVYRVEAELPVDELPARVMVHHGTREAPARPRRLDDGRWQLRLEQPIMAIAGDRVVIRRIAPPDTITGGPLVRADRRRPPARASSSPARRRARSAAPGPAAGSPAPRPAAASAAPEPAAVLTSQALAIEARLREAGATPPLDSELAAPAELAALRARGRAVRVGPAMHFHADALAAVQARLVAVLEAEGAITLARFRDELGFSRKYAQALLEHFDGEKLTLRRGDERVLRRRR